MESVIHTENLAKLYGDLPAVVDLNLDVFKGEVYGYLGPNGAGKSTTIRVLLDHIRPTTGLASIFGLDTRTDSVEIKSRVGYLPGDLTLYENMTGKDMLTYFGSLRGSFDSPYVNELAERFDCDLSRRLSELSRGNRQKVGLIQAFMGKPELLILDEPTTGLDPLIQQEFNSLIQEITHEGRTVFFSSHILPEVERICDRIGIIREGRLTVVEDMQEFTNQSTFHRIEIEFNTDFTPERFSLIPGVSNLKTEGRKLTCSVTGSPDKFIKAIAELEVANLISQEPSLEERFLTLYGEKNTDDVE